MGNKIPVRRKDSPRAKKLIWLNTPHHNYSDRKSFLITEETIKENPSWKLWTNPREFFNMGNGVDSSIVINCPLNTIITVPNYLLVLDKNENIESRWFIMDFIYLDGDPNAENPEEDPNLINFTLRRDLIVDYRNIIANNPVRVNRGMVPDSFSEELLNRESLVLNEVKDDQIPLYDEFGATQWATIFYSPVAPENMKIKYDISSMLSDVRPASIITNDPYMGSRVVFENNQYRSIQSGINVGGQPGSRLYFRKVRQIHTYFRWIHLTGKDIFGARTAITQYYGVRISLNDDYTINNAQVTALQKINDLGIKSAPDNSLTSIMQNALNNFVVNNRNIYRDQNIIPLGGSSLFMDESVERTAASERLSNRYYLTVPQQGPAPAIYGMAKMTTNPFTNFETSGAVLTGTGYTDNRQRFTELLFNWLRDSSGIYFDGKVYEGSSSNLYFNYLSRILDAIDQFNVNELDPLNTPSFNTTPTNYNGRPYGKSLFLVERKSFYFRTEQVITAGSLTLPGSNDPEYRPYNLNLDEVNCMCVSIPVGNITIDNKSMSRASLLNIINTSFTQIGRTIHDIQMLPYCPVGYLPDYLKVTEIVTPDPSQPEVNIINRTYNIDTSGVTVGGRDAIPDNLLVKIYGAANEVIYKGFIVSTSSGTKSLNISRDTFYLNPQSELKKYQMSTKVRFMAHNHNSRFDINPVSNYGIDNISLEWTIKPIKTFYRISPRFKGPLYTEPFADNKGLFIEGGFSVSQVSEEWIQYQLENSTQQQIFDRQFNSLELDNRISRETEIRNRDNALAVSRIKSGHSLAGSAVGVGMGLARGNALSLAGGISALISASSQNQVAQNNYMQSSLDIKSNDILRADNISKVSELFELSNQAIQASPNTLAKASDWNINIQTHPYIEIYSCTDAEWNYLDQYIRYNGMSIQRIDNLNKYLVGNMDYIEGSLIFTPELTARISNEISSELNSGRYIQLGLFS